MEYVPNQVSCLFWQLKFYWNIAMFIDLHILRGCFCYSSRVLYLQCYLYGPNLPFIEVCSLRDLEAWLVFEALISLGYSWTCIVLASMLDKTRRQLIQYFVNDKNIIRSLS